MRLVRKKEGEMTPEAKAVEALAQILEVTRTKEPSQLRKTELAKMRDKVMELAQWGLGVAEKPQRLKLVSTEYLEALRIVGGYEGTDKFLNDLKRSISYYGGLTENQAAAVLSPPEPDLIAELRNMGVTVDFKYRWQAYEAKRQAQRIIRSENAKAAKK